MKNQYFGDINDYLKYGLLRCLANAGLRIGVCWMLTPDDSRPDGRKIQYLLKPDIWRRHDPELFDALATAVRTRRRHVHQAERLNILPNAMFFSDRVPEAFQSRKDWLSKALTKIGSADLLFFDPDNGIEIRSKPVGRKGADKYMMWKEIEIAWCQNRALLIFQHFPREHRVRYLARLKCELNQRTPNGFIDTLITTNVVYLLAYREDHATQIRSAFRLIRERWRERVIQNNIMT